MNDNDTLKKKAAEAALSFVKSDSVIGVGTGSTVNFFIDALGSVTNRIEGAVASSDVTAARLRIVGIPVLELNSTGTLPLYVDGADEVDDDFNMIKGGGGALTREKIVAAASKQFICIVHQEKRVKIIGKEFPLPVEVIPMSRSFVAREFVKLGGNPVYREHFITDNGNELLDVHGLEILEPSQWEQRINSIPGVVENGIFAKYRADVLVIASNEGVVTLNR